jgi:glycosyltransferase involved in cell wall biosynthesis
MSGHIAFVVPRLPPAIDGLGDFTRRLWESLAGRSRWTFLVLEGAAESRRAWPEVDVLPFEACERSLIAALEDSGARTVAVQYVGYGYDARGLPRWLPAAMSAWRARAEERRLVVMFHELWATGPPWTRAFWDEGAQRRIVRDLARAADRALVSTPAWRARLRAATGVGAELAPIPSNIPVLAPCWANGAPGGIRVLVFGMDPVRRAALERHRHFVRALHAAGRLERIVLVGGRDRGRSRAPEEGLVRRLAPGVPLEAHGALGAAEVSRVIARCHLGLCATPAHLVCKAGTAMAAMAHGCAVVATGTGDPAPLVAGEHLFVFSGARRAARALAERLTPERLRAVGGEGRRWYEEHADWPVAAAAWKRHLGCARKG